MSSNCLLTIFFELLIVNVFWRLMTWSDERFYQVRFVNIQVRFARFCVEFQFLFLFFWKNEPGAVGTPRWMPPGLGCQKCHFCEKRMKKKVNKKFFELIINAAQWEKRKYRTRTPFTGRRLSNSGSRRGASSSSSTQPLHLWPILSFSKDWCLGGYNVIPLSQTVRV